MLEEPCLRLQELPWQVFQRCDFINAFPIRSARLLPEKTVVARRARAFPGCLSKGGIECFLALNGAAPVRLSRCSYVSCAAVRVRSPQVRSVRSVKVRFPSGSAVCAESIGAAAQVGFLQSLCIMSFSFYIYISVICYDITNNMNSIFQALGLNICLESKRGPGFCKIVWTDERKEKPRFLTDTMSSYYL